MARIYLDARNITAQPAGVARYARCLIPELVRLAPEHEFVTIRHDSNREPIEVEGSLKEVFVSQSIDDLSNFLVGHRTLRDVFKEHGPADIYHDLFHILPRSIHKVIGGGKIVITLHDFVWLDHADASQPTWLKARTIETFARAAIPHALQASDFVISISEPTTRRASKWLKDGAHDTIYHGVHESFFEPVEPPRVLDIPEGCPYVVAIGNAKPYKNLQRLVEAFDRLLPDHPEARLVLIGNCADLDVPENVILAGFLDDEELRRVLGLANAFVFPSLVEGFGLPILEAMAMGIPTLVSDLEPMRTIAGDGALLFDPLDPTDIARQLSRILEDDELHARYAELGLKRAKGFRWPETARKTLAVYDQISPSPSRVY
ncbi:MAG: glycosyltransferase family 4 protein [Bradymonadaceae bacterium]